MEGQRFLHSLRIQNLLSFDDEGLEIELQPLNVLIGSNASGKSNLIETIGLLQATPSELPTPIHEGGGISEWLWKGGTKTPTATVETVVAYPHGPQPLRYRLQFTMVGQRLELVDEAVENVAADPNHEDVYFYYRYRHGRPVLNVRTGLQAPPGTGQGRTQRSLRREDLRPDQSVFSQRKDPDQYPELTYLSAEFAAIRLFREWNLGRYTAPRLPQKADLPNDFLRPDASNLSLVLNALKKRTTVRQLLAEKLRLAYDAVEEIDTHIEGSTVQLFVYERGLNEPIPATRLSDGTLRYLCLLAILLHPEPPPLICIEEPELGLHPDLMSTIAELLIDAAQRTQLIVTTHSSALVSALSQTPEAVIVCERDHGGSRFRRLDADKLRPWLERHMLGELWQMGELGGTRW